MKAIIPIFLLTLCALGASAESPRTDSYVEFSENAKKEFEKWRTKTKTEFEQYRNRLNQEFADMLERQGWETASPKEAIPLPTKPKPTQPLAPEPSPGQASGPITPDKVVDVEQSIPDIPVTLPKPSGPKSYPINFTFFNTKCGLNAFDTSTVNITKTSTSALASAWRSLSGKKDWEPLLNDCLRLREEMSLCDWGYLLLIEKVAQVLYPNSPNNQGFLSVFLLNQSGYDCRLATINGTIGPIVHTSHTIYGRSYYSLDNKNYYVCGTLVDKRGNLSYSRVEYRPNSTPIRLLVNRLPKFSYIESQVRTYSSQEWKQAPPFTLSVNPSLVSFFDQYPLVDWHLYALAPLSYPLQQTLIPFMQILTNGLPELEAVSLILDYVQDGFKYLTDDQQFGREKPFFFDDNFYYSHNDCEDRAILFSKIVRDVMNLDVVLLKLPNHLATAVRFSPSTAVSGTKLTVDGHTYVFCDPTCTNGEVGFLPPQFSTAKPTVYKIQE